MKALVFLLLLASCYRTGTDESTLFRSVPTIEGVVTFAQMREHALARCVNCHAWVNDEAQVATRVVAGNPQASSLYVRVFNGSMPPSGGTLTTAQLEIIEGYIRGIRTTPPVTALEPSYASLKVHLLERSCLSCHDGGVATSFLAREDVVARADDILFYMETGADIGMPMPPLDENGQPRAPTPSPEVISTFRRWIDEGMP